MSISLRVALPLWRTEPAGTSSRRPRSSLPHTPESAGIGATWAVTGTGLWKPLGENHSRVTITRAVSCFLPPTKQQLEGSVSWRDSRTLVCEQSLATLLHSEAGGLHAHAHHKGSIAGAGSPVHTEKTGRCKAVSFHSQKKPFYVASRSNSRRSACHFYEVYDVINNGQGTRFRWKTKSHRVYFCVPQFPHHERMGPHHLPIQGQFNSLWKPLQVRCLIYFKLVIINNPETTFLLK